MALPSIGVRAPGRDQQLGLISGDARAGGFEAVSGMWLLPCRRAAAALGPVPSELALVIFGCRRGIVGSPLAAEQR